MSEQIAKKIATKWLEERDMAGDFEIRKIDARDDVFLAFWDRKDHQLIAGNAPLLIDLAKGTISITGTARPMEYYLNNYRVTGDPHVEPIKKVKISSGSTSANKGLAITILKSAAALGLIEAKHAVDSILEGRAAYILPLDQNEAETTANQLRDCGFIADVELCPPETRVR